MKATREGKNASERAPRSHYGAGHGRPGTHWMWVGFSPATHLSPSATSADTSWLTLPPDAAAVSGGPRLPPASLQNRQDQRFLSLLSPRQAEKSAQTRTTCTSLTPSGWHQPTPAAAAAPQNTWAPALPCPSLRCGSTNLPWPRPPSPAWPQHQPGHRPGPALPRPPARQLQLVLLQQCALVPAEPGRHVNGGATWPSQHHAD